MTSRIATVANLAYQLFSSIADQGATSVGKDSLSRLLHLLGGVTAKDVDFDTRLVTDASRIHTPVLYLHIVENGVLSMGIFVLRPGARIPLHDHPGMFGLCKLLHGSLRCRAYSPVPASAAKAAAALAGRLPRWQLQELVPVRLATDGVFSPSAQPLLLTPTDGGYHELQALGDGAAFLDILAPPYDHDLGHRVCRYYTEVALPRDPHQLQHASPAITPALVQHHQSATGPVQDAAGNHLLPQQQQQQQQQHPVDFPSEDEARQQIYLLEIPQPRDFVCSSVDYTGPKVT